MVIEMIFSLVNFCFFSPDIELVPKRQRPQMEEVDNKTNNKNPRRSVDAESVEWPSGPRRRNRAATAVRTTVDEGKKKMDSGDF
jgi:hypothetical protein